MKDASTITIKAGMDNLNNTNSATYQEMKVRKVILHPKYEQCRLYYDMVLLQLEGSFRITPYVQPVCVSTEPVASGTQCLVSGWGLTGTSHLLE